MKLKNELLILILCFLSMTLSVTAQNKATDTKEKAQLVYKQLLAKIKNGDVKINFTAFRTAFAEMNEYHYDGMSKEDRQKIFKLLANKNFKETVKQATKILEENYVDANVHYAIFVAQKELKDDRDADYHKAVLVDLLNSIQNGNDGKTTKTAFLPINISEE